MRSVVVHSYVKGAKAMKRLIAHVKYIGNRPGPDREEGRSRLFFDNKREDIGGKEFRDSLSEVQQKRTVLAHKLILSPGIPGVDMQRYTRELIEGIGRNKGLDLNWSAVIHKNTDHDHAHVIVFASDKVGRNVNFNRQDYKELRDLGDRYLEREHYYERFMTRDADRAMNSFDYDRGRTFQLMVGDILPARAPEQRAKERHRWTKEEAVERLPRSEKVQVGSEVYSKYSNQRDLMALEQQVREGSLSMPVFDYQQVRSWIEVKEKLGDDYYERIDRGDKEIMLVREFHKFDKDLKRTLPQEFDSSRRMSREAYVRETAGRFSDYHEIYTSAKARERLLDLKESRPDMAEAIDRELAYLKEIEHESRFGGQNAWRDLDEILGDNHKRLKEPEKELVSKRESTAKEQKAFVEQHIAVEAENKESREREDDERTDERSEL